MRTMKNLVAAFFILFTTESAFAASAPVTCGSTLGKHKTYTLPDDLDCSTATAPITVRDRVVLNLNNHKYVGAIILEGRQADSSNQACIGETLPWQ